MSTYHVRVARGDRYWLVHVGAALGVSYQRAHQLVSSSKLVRPA